MHQPFFVDLSNFYGQFLNSELRTESSDILREYFCTWLDYDLLAERLTGSPQSIWIFYSGGKLGPSEARVDKDFLLNFVKRINSIEGVTAYDVNIPGEQREQIKINCLECGSEKVNYEFKSEKGVDASLVVHLFDTMESWSKAYLLAGDADYVPAVKSLRRRGKIIIGAGFSNASQALVRECYNYLNLLDEYIYTDFFLFKLLRKKGIIYRWFTEVKPDLERISHDPEGNRLDLTFSCTERGGELSIILKSKGPRQIYELKQELSGLISRTKMKNATLDPNPQKAHDDGNVMHLTMEIFLS